MTIVHQQLVRGQTRQLRSCLPCLHSRYTPYMVVTENTVRMRSVGLQSVAWQGLVLGFMHSCLCTQDSPVGRPSLLPLCSDLGCSPQLPARKRPRMTLPLSTASPPQQSRFRRLEWLAGQLHQRLSEGRLKVYVLDGFVSQMVSLSP